MKSKAVAKVDETNPECLEWLKKEKTINSLIRNAHTASLVQRYLEHVATGARHTVFYKENNITWSDLARHFWLPSLSALMSIANTMGEQARLRKAEDALVKRAVEGVNKPVYYKGKQVDTVKEYSDALLSLHLKALAPDKYADRQKVEHKGVVLNLQVDGVR